MHQGAEWGNLQIDYQAPGITLESYQLVDTPILTAQLVRKALYKLLELVPVDVKVNTWIALDPCSELLDPLGVEFCRRT